MTTSHSSAAGALRRRPIVALSPPTRVHPRPEALSPAQVVGPSAAATVMVTLAVVIEAAAAAALIMAAISSGSVKIAVASCVAGLAVLAATTLAIRILSREDV